jgi:hypothetical protein
MVVESLVKLKEWLVGQAIRTYLFEVSKSAPDEG